MRDPRRIPRVLAKIGTLWSADPDLRLGQLLINEGGWPSADPFHVEDEATEAALDVALRVLGIDVVADPAWMAAQDATMESLTEPR